MSEEVAGLHLVLGDEELLIERAVAAVLRQARKQAGTDNVPVEGSTLRPLTMPLNCDSYCAGSA